MSTIACFEQIADCPPAALQLVSSPSVPSQRDGDSVKPNYDNFLSPTFLVPELGRITLLHKRLVQLPGDSQPRLRRTMAIELGSVVHCARVTEPAANRDSVTESLDSIIMLPGCLEMIDAGTGKNLHDALAPHFPNKRIISIATDGVGRYCQKIGWRQGLTKNFQSMATDRHRLINILKGDGTIDLVDVSMGSMISLELLAFNTTLPQEAVATSQQDRWLDISAVVHYSSAHVTPGRVVPDIGLRFGPHIYYDSLKMLGVLGSLPTGHVAMLKALPRSLPAIVGNGMHILKGVDPKKKAAAARDYHTGYCTGQNDPLGQLEQTRQLAELYPGTVTLQIKPNTGHAACMDAKAAATDIANMLESVRRKQPATA